jgi:hypothetical protein
MGLFDRVRRALAAAERDGDGDGTTEGDGEGHLSREGDDGTDESRPAPEAADDGRTAAALRSRSAAREPDDGPADGDPVSHPDASDGADDRTANDDGPEGGDDPGPGSRRRSDEADGTPDRDPSFEDLSAAAARLAEAADRLDRKNESLRTAAGTVAQRGSNSNSESESESEADPGAPSGSAPGSSKGDGGDDGADPRPAGDCSAGPDPGHAPRVDSSMPPVETLRPPASTTVETFRDRAAAFAAAHDADGEDRLDYTPGSLAAVDRSLADGTVAAVHDTETAEGDDEDPTAAVAETVADVGSYFGEVLVRTYGGRWTTDGDVPEVQLDNGDGGATSVDVFRAVAETLRRGIPLGAVHDALRARSDAVDRRVYDGAGPVSRPTGGTPPDPEGVRSGRDTPAADRPRQLAAQAEAFAAANADYELTFEPSSLRRLDALGAAAAGDELAGVDPDAEPRRLLAHALPYGAYFGEVIRRSHPGRAAWLDEDGYTIGLVAEDAAGRETAVTVDAVQAAATCLVGNDSFSDVYERLLDAR